MTNLIQEVYNSYTEALLATSYDDEGTDLTTHTLSDFTKLQIRRDITQLIQLADVFVPNWRKYWSPAQLGHDFLLTRNHHGAGFWDRAPTGDKRHDRTGQKLTAIARTFGEQDAYLGDDGLIHV